MQKKGNYLVFLLQVLAAKKKTITFKEIIYYT